MHLFIVTGLSGAGKSVALRTLEDLGIFTVDNMPAPLVNGFAQLLMERGEYQEAALAMDIRNESFLTDWHQVAETLTQAGHQVDILFLEATNSALLKRFKTTRRPHPLGGETLLPNIERERQKLGRLREQARWITDTSDFTVHELRAHLFQLFDDHQRPPLIINIFSFGFKKGIPQEADIVFDVRFLPNPYFVEELAPLPGFDPKVASFLEAHPETKEFVDKLSDLLHYLLPKYRDEGKAYLSCSIGCTGGQHRSVYIAEALTEALRARGHELRIGHRDVQLPEGYGTTLPLE